MNWIEGHTISRRTLLLALLLSVQFTALAHAGYIGSIPVENRAFESSIEPAETSEEEYDYEEEVGE